MVRRVDRVYNKTAEDSGEAHPDEKLLVEDVVARKVLHPSEDRVSDDLSHIFGDGEHAESDTGHIGGDYKRDARP